jgi:hypothetical protein
MGDFGKKDKNISLARGVAQPFSGRFRACACYYAGSIMPALA